MERLILSMMRFSTAMTLYGYEQLQSSIAAVQGEKELNKGLDRLQGAIDSLSDALVDNLGGGKKETLRSITDVAEDMVGRFFSSWRSMDPREMVKATAGMVEKSSETVPGEPGKVTSMDEDEPKRAADVLS